MPRCPAESVVYRVCEIRNTPHTCNRADGRPAHIAIDQPFIIVRIGVRQNTLWTDLDPWESARHESRDAWACDSLPIELAPQFVQMFAFLVCQVANPHLRVRVVSRPLRLPSLREGIPAFGPVGSVVK